MNTQWMLTGRYEGLPVIPIDTVIRDFFPHLKRPQFLLKCEDGSIKLPLIRMDGKSQKSTKGVYIADLATYIDERREEAMRDFNQFHH